MDIVILEGDRISRNEIYFDRALLPLLQGEGGLGGDYPLTARSELG